MPQSTAALREKAQALRLLKNHDARVQGTPAVSRTVWARTPFNCPHGACVALAIKQDGLWVLVKDAKGVEAWAPIARILSGEHRREWARRGFG